MIKRILVCGLLATTATAEPTLEKIGDFLMVTPAGKIVPAESAASIYDLATLSAQAVANAQAAAIASQGLAQVTMALADLLAHVNAQENTLYLDSFNVLSVGPPLDVDTNLIARIIDLDPMLRVHTNPDYVISRVTMSFTEDPGYMPIFRVNTTLKSTNQWDVAEIVDQGYTDILIGSTYYEDAVWSDVAIPAAWTSAFFRASCDVRGSGTNVTNFAVNNGVEIRGQQPLTATFTQGTNTLKIVGGVICVP